MPIYFYFKSVWSRNWTFYYSQVGIKWVLTKHFLCLSLIFGDGEPFIYVGDTGTLFCETIVLS
ncbi:protein of unknown function [Moritella yayanosii]|uniref:Uncharacterized protein n=1 Tax=Moritella yayanosii TaxID=69539 RepID=A0A330LRW1_9GAMM|nr:protein of unknown function [Moritella yayanosii]